MASPADLDPSQSRAPRPHRLSRSTLWLVAAVAATVLLTAAALVAAGG